MARIDAEEEARYQRRIERESRQRSGWRKGAPQCWGCRRILSGHGVKCDNCHGWAR